MRLFIVGYMCSGKTTLGKFLADRLSCTFIDLDEYVENQEKMSVTDIFITRGEDAFRQLEHNYLKDLCLIDNVIIATGGGTPCYNDNMTLINTCGTSVYLETSVNVLIDRLLLMGHTRPIVAGKTREELDEFVSTHLKERESFYQRSNIKLNGDVWDVERITNELLMRLREII